MFEGLISVLIVSVPGLCIYFFLLYLPFQGGVSVVGLSIACHRCKFWLCFHLLCVQIILVQ